MMFLKYATAVLPLVAFGYPDSKPYHYWRETRLPEKLESGENINDIRGCPSDCDTKTGQLLPEQNTLALEDAAKRLDEEAVDAILRRHHAAKDDESKAHHRLSPDHLSQALKAAQHMPGLHRFTVDFAAVDIVFDHNDNFVSATTRAIKSEY